MAKKPDASNQAAVQLPKGGFKVLTGTSNPDASHELLNQLIKSLYLPQSFGADYRDKTINAALATMLEIAPKDSLEGILATQMVSTHSTAMECLRRAALENQTFEGRNLALSHAHKLLRLYLEQMKALNKHRGKSDQKVVIEHVNIAPGAQAIVGNVELTNRPAQSEDAKQIDAQQMHTIDMKAKTKQNTPKLPTKNAQRKK
jgi:hypothetical protein